MSNTQQSLNVPPRDTVMPNVPETQTNMGTLEHTGLPIEPIWQITDIPPDFTWMSEQWKFHDNFSVTVNNKPGEQIWTTRVIQSDSVLSTDLAQWHDIPFGTSRYWNGKVSYRFTIIKPPRVAGKLLIRYRQDAFGRWNSGQVAPDVIDKKLRGVLKEWDLAQSSQFEFDVTGSNPVRARFTHLYRPDPPTTTVPTDDVRAISAYRVPKTIFEMGRITVEVAQTVMPGGIFPDTYHILVEKSLKDAQFMTPTDARTSHILALYDAKITL
nr:MAG: putative capsid protein 2 [Polycipiviridae sp.]